MSKRSRPRAHDRPEHTAAPFPSAPADTAPAQSSGTATWVDSAAPPESPRANSLFKQNTSRLWMFDGHQETNHPPLIYSFIWPIQIPFVDRKVTYTIQIHGKYVHHCWFKNNQFKLNHVLKMFGFPWYGTSIFHCYIATIHLFCFIFIIIIIIIVFFLFTFNTLH